MAQITNSAMSSKGIEMGSNPSTQPPAQSLPVSIVSSVQSSSLAENDIQLKKAAEQGHAEALYFSLMQKLKLGAVVLKNNLGQAIGTLFTVWVPNVKDNHDVRVTIYNQDKVEEISLKKNSMHKDYWSVFVSTIQGGEAGNRYLFKIFRENTFHQFADLAARKVEYEKEENAHEIKISTCKSVIVDDFYLWTSCHPPLPATRELIIYQLHFPAFSDSTHSSFIKGAKKRLRHIKNLNFTAIQLLPTHVFSNTQETTFGYDGAYLFSVSPVYGKAEDLKSFIDKAHRLGLAVLFDVVFNHVPFKGNPFWNYQFNVNRRDKGYYLSGSESQWGICPDFSREEVREFFLQNLEMYIEEYHADGFRFDCTSLIDQEAGGRDFLKMLIDTSRKMKDKKIHFIFEQAIPNVSSDANWIYPNAKNVYDYQRAVKSRNPMQEKEFLQQAIQREGSFVNYLLGSHDECSQSWEEKKVCYFAHLFDDGEIAKQKSMLAWCLNVILPGIPMLFMGSEFLEKRKFDKDSKIDWSSQAPSSQQMQDLVKGINLIRKNSNALRTGKIEILDIAEEKRALIAYLQYTDHERLLIVINFEKEHIPNFLIRVPKNKQLIIESRWHPLFCSRSSLGEKNPEEFVCFSGEWDKINISLRPLYPMSVTIFKCFTNG